ncbi:hypothetical protein GCM10027436_46390 [Actinophytocola sediminis]
MNSNPRHRCTPPPYCHPRESNPPDTRVQRSRPRVPVPTAAKGPFAASGAVKEPFAAVRCSGGGEDYD